MTKDERLEGLDSRDLYILRQKIDDKLDKIKNSEKKIIWFVSDPWINFEWFKEEDYDKAYQYWIEKLTRVGSANLKRAGENHSELSHWIQEFPVLRGELVNEVEYKGYFKEERV